MHSFINFAVTGVGCPKNYWRCGGNNILPCHYSGNSTSSRKHGAGKPLELRLARSSSCWPSLGSAPATGPTWSSSVHSRRAYGFALDEFFAWYRAAERGAFRKALVQEYRVHLEVQGLAPSTINVRLAAIKKLAAEASDNRMLAPEVAAGIEKVKGAKLSGNRVGSWLAKKRRENCCGLPPATARKQAAIAPS